ncbi:MAG: M3 family metallopeptidase [Bacteroidales bacterium]|nr:M3 family metallopeptidase [Bacteroidales bacterium]MBP3670658.1 M3 family metallopeptidase [Bacteroidaceae bacterium]
MRKFLVSISLGFFALMTTQCTTNQNQIDPFCGEYDTPHNTVPFDKISNALYEPAFQKGVDLQVEEINAIVNQRSIPTFENTIVALEESGSYLNRVAGVFFALQGAESDDEMMEISQRIQPLLSEHSNNISLNEQLFERIKFVYDHRAEMELTPEQMMLVEETYDSFASSGANLEGEARERYRELSVELSNLTLTFSQNALRATNAYAKELTEEELAGLPQSAIDAAAALATSKGKEGSYMVDLSFPSYSAFMKYSTRRDLREELYRAYNSRSIGGEFDNLPILTRIAEVRLEIAKLFGCNTFAEYKLKHTMAGTPEAVYKLLNQLLDAYKPVAIEEVAELQKFAAEKEGADFQLMPWDFSFYAEQLKSMKYDLNDEMLRPYFKLDNVIDGVFGLATSLYGLQFTENKDIPVYHEEASAYEVTDANGEYIGVLYTDFFPRPGKRQGAWMTEFKGQWMENDTVDSRPHVTIVMNFTRPTATAPSLLTYGEVETFLHEFGHALHGLLSKVTYNSLSGTNVYRDFVELPSQFNENFLAEKEFLDGFARHYETGETIPAELVEKIIASSQYHAAYACVRQLSFGMLDMAWHSITAPVAADAVLAFEKEALLPTQVTPSVDGTALSPQFGHIFSGGYAAGYYGYKWAEVLDADAFAAFKEKGIYDQETARAFRENVLERGGTENPMELYKRFRGHEPSIDALMRRDGIIK